MVDGISREKQLALQMKRMAEGAGFTTEEFVNACKILMMSSVLTRICKEGGEYEPGVDMFLRNLRLQFMLNETTFDKNKERLGRKQ